MASSSCSSVVAEGAEASSSKSTAQADFLPSRDLPPLRRGAEPQQAKAILRGLEALEVALGLTREEEVRLIIDDRDEGEINGSTVVQRGTNEEENDDDYEPSGGAAQGHDEVERRYAQSWLTRIASGSVDLSTLDSTTISSDESDLVDRAARALAALCCRPASSAQLTSFVFCTSTSSSADAAVVARARIGDVPITADALGNRTWGAAPLLARRLVGRWVRGQFLETRARRAEGKPLRVLELGAGTGLVGLALAAAASASRGRIHVDLTDYHPHVLANLDANAKLNGFREQQEVENEASVRVRKLDWQAIHEEAQGAGSSSRYTSTAQTLPDEAAGGSVGTSSGSGSGSEQGRLPPYLQTLQLDESEPTYDVLIAADCIYDVHHPVWIRSVAEKYLARPSPGSSEDGGEGGVLWLITPLRETHKAELQAIYEAFPLAKERRAEGEGRRRERLCITWQGDEVGYDDFGPKSLWSGGEAGASRSGLRTTYRTFEVRWVR